MAKYSLIFKLKVVTAYLNGEGGYEYLTKKYGVKTTSQVRRWISAFKEFGKDGCVESEIIQDILQNLSQLWQSHT